MTESMAWLFTKDRDTTCIGMAVSTRLEHGHGARSPCLDGAAVAKT